MKVNLEAITGSWLSGQQPLSTLGLLPVVAVFVTMSHREFEFRAYRDQRNTGSPLEAVVQSLGSSLENLYVQTADLAEYQRAVSQLRFAPALADWSCVIARIQLTGEEHPPVSPVGGRPTWQGSRLRSLCNMETVD